MDSPNCQILVKLYKKLIGNVVALNKWIYFSFVESRCFISLLHLDFNPPMPHSPLTQKPTIFWCKSIWPPSKKTKTLKLERQP